MPDAFLTIDKAYTSAVIYAKHGGSPSRNFARAKVLLDQPYRRLLIGCEDHMRRTTVRSDGGILAVGADDMNVAMVVDVRPEQLFGMAARDHDSGKKTMTIANFTSPSCSSRSVTYPIAESSKLVAAHPE